LGPLAVSSANRSGLPDARSAAELVAALGPSLALVLDDGPVRGGRASSVVSVDPAGHISVLREGALGRGLIEAALAEA
jgi:tRNA A37 threonylcarbamoyladenosine synthetase subunit TsaC/SUA5/YrdC